MYPDKIPMCPLFTHSQVMSSPELTAGFMNPRVQKAVMDMAQNPQNVEKYKDDKEAMMVSRCNESLVGEGPSQFLAQGNKLPACAPTRTP